MSEAQAPTTSPIHAEHEKLGAKFAPFGGWLMPVEYDGVRSEHAAVRTAVGLFDVSHLGTLQVRGTGVARALNGLFTNDLDRIGEGQAQYTLLCDDQGQVVDDLIVYLLPPSAGATATAGFQEVLLIPNAANAAKVRDAVTSVVAADVEVIDAHEDMAIIAVQGPQADAVLADVGVATDMAYMSVAHASIAERDVIVCRSGYTGERGYEILVSSQYAVAVWNQLLTAATAHGGMACGLGARDTLRTEMGYPLHGQDLGGDIGPIQARLSWAVGWKKDDFSGRDALLAQRGSDLLPKLGGLVLLDRGVPRAGMAVHLFPDGPTVGHVTSGTFSPTLRTGIGIALLDSTVAAGAEVVVNVRGRWLAARVSALPLVASHTRD